MSTVDKTSNGWSNIGVFLTSWHVTLKFIVGT
jgi:hypothetical protein